MIQYKVLYTTVYKLEEELNAIKEQSSLTDPIKSIVGFNDVEAAICYVVDIND